MDDDKKKVLFIHHAKIIGGAPTSMLNIIRYLDKKKFKAKILFIYNNPDVIKLCVEENIDYRVLKGIFFERFYVINSFSEAEASFMYKLRVYPFIRSLISWLFVGFFFAKKIVEEESPDILHTNTTFLTDWVWGTRNLKIKRFVHVREPFSQHGIGVKRMLYRFILKKYTNRLFAISIDNKNRLGLANKTDIVYNFMPDPFLSKVNSPKSIIRVAYLGGDARIKGFDVIKKALPFINENVIIQIAGHIGNKNALIFTPNIEYVGTITDIYDFLSKADILIFPSIVPHFAKPIIEAGMCKLAVIASDVEGMSEIIESNKNGILFPVGNAQKLAESINFLAINTELRKKYGYTNYQFVKSKFSITANLPIIEEAYQAE